MLGKHRAARRLEQDSSSACFQGRSYNSPPTGYLYLKDSSDLRYTIVLNQLEKLKVSDFLEGNIILDVYVHSGENIQATLLKELYDVEFDNQSDEFVKGLLQKIKKEALSLLELNPSYGCSTLALCKKIEFEKDWCYPA